MAWRVPCLSAKRTASSLPTTIPLRSLVCWSSGSAAACRIPGKKWYLTSSQLPRVPSNPVWRNLRTGRASETLRIGQFEKSDEFFVTNQNVPLLRTINRVYHHSCQRDLIPNDHQLGLSVRGKRQYLWPAVREKKTPSICLESFLLCFWAIQHWFYSADVRGICTSLPRENE